MSSNGRFGWKSSEVEVKLVSDVKQPQAIPAAENSDVRIKMAPKATGED